LFLADISINIIDLQKIFYFHFYFFLEEDEDKDDEEDDKIMWKKEIK